jgi:TrmH family RNA methyltransferase
VRVTPEQFRTISITERASGIAAIARQHWSALHQLPVPERSCWIVIETIRSPGNLGTIFRTAAATGAAGVIFLSNDCDPFDPAVVRASMAGLFHLNVARTTTRAFRDWARANGVTTIGLSPRAPRLWTDFPASRNIALLVGEERRGLTSDAQQICDLNVRLPMTGVADSLNVGVAAGVMMYEWVRRASASSGGVNSTAPCGPP